MSSLKFRLKKTVEKRNYLIEKIKHNDLMSAKYKKTCKYLNYVEHLLILASTVSGCASISAFSSLLAFPIGITSSLVGLKNCVITAGIKNFKSIMKKRKKDHDEIVLLGKANLNNLNFLVLKS